MYKRRKDDDRDENGYPKGLSQNATSGGGEAHKSRLDRIIDSLLIAGIIALVSTSLLAWNTATKLETAFSERNRFYDREITRIDGIDQRQDGEIRGLDNRITTLERAERANQPDARDRQER